MSNLNQKTVSTDGAVQEEIRRFPLRRLYYVLLPILTLLSIFSVTIQNDNINTRDWKLTTEIKVSTITLTILLFSWLPVLLPWIITFFPRFRSSLASLREGGVEEIEAGILRIKLQPGIKTAAEKYESNVLSQATESNVSPEVSLREVEASYRDIIATLESANRVDPEEALKRIDQLVNYYNRVRDEMRSSPERTRLFTQISSTMWSLMPSTKNFPVHQRLNSPDGGERLSAYKFLEWQPDINFMSLLLPRAAGILETPFGQYSALLALRRMVVGTPLASDQQRMIRQILEWASRLDFVGSDRRHLMNTILTSLST